ncbi:MAG: hypothetical protein U0Q16_05100 [Bryobacteraceae bacterium]
MIRTLLAFLAAAQIYAQTLSPPAQPDVDRVRALVEAGALPRKALDEIEWNAAEARDSETLKRTLYGQLALEQFTDEVSRDMMAAAERQFDRRKQRLEAAKKLVNEGISPVSSLVPHLEEFDRGRKTYDAAAARLRVFQELTSMVRAEQEAEARIAEIEHENQRNYFEGAGVLNPVQVNWVQRAFELQFKKALPVSAQGETALHISLGFDHRGRIDVPLHPDSTEGSWLRRQLEMIRVPYMAFRGAVAGQSTGAHIHIGPPSQRIRRTD